MDRSVWKRFITATLTAAGGGFALGCWGGGVEPLPPRPQAPYTVSSRSTVPATATNRPEGGINRRGEGAGGVTRPEVSGDTERDQKFARFLQDHSAGMIRKAAVGIENKGELRVEISRAVAPEDTLTLTKSLLDGARSDFPGRPITLSLYDPADEPILKARFRPGEGVHYQIAHGGGGGASKAQAREEPRTKAAKAGDPIARGGVTERDQKFANWAEEHGRPMLRYVEADLERHGRLWFGITQAVKPGDVKPLAQSLLEGARKEFPRGELVATVFDPDGGRIGRAHFGGDGEVHWEK